MSDVKRCAWCGAKTKTECKAVAKCLADNPSAGWGCMDHIHPTADAVINALSHVSGKSESDILKRELEIAAEQVCSLEDQLAALREELAIKTEAYQGAHMMCTDLKASLTAAEQRNEELEKNAARYIWLRDTCTDSDVQAGLHWLGSSDNTDEDIDLHMTEGTTEGYAKTTETEASDKCTCIQQPQEPNCTDCPRRKSGASE